MIGHALRTRNAFAAVVLALAMAWPASALAQASRAEEAGRLRTRLEGLLRDELTRCWYPRAVDRDRGGFHQEFARDWTARTDANRFLVYQSRMTWTAAAYARHSKEHRDEYLTYVRHGVDYLDRVMRDGTSGGFHWILSPGGEVEPRLGAEKHVYGTAFVLYAASLAREVTGDERALKVARYAFEWLEAHAHDAEHGGYFEALTRAGKPILSWPEG